MQSGWYVYPHPSPRGSYSRHTTAFLRVLTRSVESKTCLGLQPTRSVGTSKKWNLPCDSIGAYSPPYQGGVGGGHA